MNGFFDAITALPTPFNMVVLIVIIGCTAGVVGTCAAEFRKYLCHRSEIELKREMLERGLQSKDIEQVMEAKLPDTQKPPVVRKCPS